MSRKLALQSNELLSFLKLFIKFKILTSHEIICIIFQNAVEMAVKIHF